MLAIPQRLQPQSATWYPTVIEQQRIAWIDACKAVGMFLVVYAHLQVQGALHEFIYLFHMPLFFFLSGFLHTRKPAFADYFRKKAMQFLLPYTSFLLLLSPFEIVPMLHHDPSGHPFSDALFQLLWGGNELRGSLAIFWFVSCLFFTQQIMNFLLVKFRLSLVGLFAIASLLLSYLNSIYFPGFSLPLGVHIAAAAIPLYFLGFLANRVDLESWWLLSICAVGMAYGAWAVRFNPALHFNMRPAQYGVPALSLLLALCCIVWMLYLVRKLVLFRPLRLLLPALGSASLGIMFLHLALASLIPGMHALRQTTPLMAAAVVFSLSFLLTRLLSRSMICRALLLGSVEDWARLGHSDEPPQRLSGSPLRLGSLRGSPGKMQPR